MQTPAPWIDLHDALSPHWSSSTLGVQSSTQYLLPDWSCSAHCGAAVTPAGTSVGHAALVHDGAQTSPVTPWMVKAFSSAPQPSLGSCGGVES